MFELDERVNETVACGVSTTNDSACTGNPTYTASKTKICRKKRKRSKTKLRIHFKNEKGQTKPNQKAALREHFLVFESLTWQRACDSLDSGGAKSIRRLTRPAVCSCICHTLSLIFECRNTKHSLPRQLPIVSKPKAFRNYAGIAKCARSNGTNTFHFEVCNIISTFGAVCFSGRSRDENGYKCHCASEAHIRQMGVFSENPENFMNDFSTDFEKGFLTILKRKCAFIFFSTSLLSISDLLLFCMCAEAGVSIPM
jgi:hypothetical protein